MIITMKHGTYTAEYHHTRKEFKTNPTKINNKNKRSPQKIVKKGNNNRGR